MSELFVEVTGRVLDQVLLAANILAANLADRGAEIRPVVVRYPYDTPRGREVVVPNPMADRRTVEVAASRFGELLGEPELAQAEIVDRLVHYGVTVEEQGDILHVRTSAYRADYLHAVDAIEDFAISRGYDTFEPLMPEEFTVGALTPETLFCDRVRDLAIGCGFEEAIGNLLTSIEDLRERMNLDDPTDFSPLHGAKLVRIKNVMNRNYSVVRDWIVPTLLEIESKSSSALYPHRVFEVGEVCVWDAQANVSSRTEQRLACSFADHEVGFSETQAHLHALLKRLGVDYTLKQVEHPSFIPGRAAWIVSGDTKLGLLGEIHPAVLEHWGIFCPVGVFELSLPALSQLAP